MEGCSTCASYDHGCCEDGLTPALGPDQEVGHKIIGTLYFKQCAFIFNLMFNVGRAAGARARCTDAAWTVRPRPRGRTSWAAPRCPGRAAPRPPSPAPAPTTRTSGSTTWSTVSSSVKTPNIHTTLCRKVTELLKQIVWQAGAAGSGTEVARPGPTTTTRRPRARLTAWSRAAPRSATWRPCRGRAAASTASGATTPPPGPAASSTTGAASATGTGAGSQ